MTGHPASGDGIDPARVIEEYRQRLRQRHIIRLTSAVIILGPLLIWGYAVVGDTVRALVFGAFFAWFWISLVRLLRRGMATNSYSGGEQD